MREAISGVDRNLIVQAARMYATAKNAAIYWALGIPEHSHGTDNGMSLVHLALLTGHIGREGTGLNPLRGQNNVQGARIPAPCPSTFPAISGSMTKRRREIGTGLEYRAGRA